MKQNSSIKKQIKTVSAVLATLLIILSLSGCWNSRELNALAIVLGVGMDKAEPPDKFEITAQIVKSSGISSSKGSDSSGEAPYYNITDTGTDVFSVFREFTHVMSRKLYLPHNQVIIFGEELARDGVHDSLDLLLRDPETRMNLYVLVAKGKAADVLAVEAVFEEVPASEIAQLVEAQKATSQTAIVNLGDFALWLTSSTRSAVAPIIEIKEKKDKKEAYISGCAVFKADKMVAELNPEETRGYLWVVGEVGSGVVNVNVDGKQAALEIIRAKSKVTPEIKQDGSILVKIEITETGNLASQSGAFSLVTTKGMKQLEEAQNQAIEAEIRNTIDKAREINVDIFGFGESVRRRYPHKWKSLETDWNMIFKKIDVEIDVKSKLGGSGRLIKPYYPEKE